MCLYRVLRYTRVFVLQSEWTHEQWTFSEFVAISKTAVRSEKRAERTRRATIVSRRATRMWTTIRRFCVTSFCSFSCCVLCLLYVSSHGLSAVVDIIREIVRFNLNVLQGISISIGILIMEQFSGIYAELAFLDVALNFGQSLIAFTIFGLDPSLGKFGCWLRKTCKRWRAGNIARNIIFVYIQGDNSKPIWLLLGNEWVELKRILLRDCDFDDSWNKIESELSVCILKTIRRYYKTGKREMWRSNFSNF